MADQGEKTQRSRVNTFYREKVGGSANLALIIMLGGGAGLGGSYGFNAAEDVTMSGVRSVIAEALSPIRAAHAQTAAVANDNRTELAVREISIENSREDHETIIKIDGRMGRLEDDVSGLRDGQRLIMDTLLELRALGVREP